MNLKAKTMTWTFEQSCSYSTLRKREFVDPSERHDLGEYYTPSYLLASKLAKGRDVAGAERAFREAIKNANGSEPETVMTDSRSSKSYRDGIKYAFGQNPPKHIANAGIRKPHATNNRIERMNGTLREPIKVQKRMQVLRLQDSGGPEDSV